MKRPSPAVPPHPGKSIANILVDFITVFFLPVTVLSSWCLYICYSVLIIQESLGTFPHILKYSSRTQS